MANIKGGRAARKRDRQNEKARKRNAVCKAKLHDAHKKLFKFADANNRADAEKKFKEFVSGLDKAVKKGIITKNTAGSSSTRWPSKIIQGIRECDGEGHRNEYHSGALCS